MCPPQWFGRRNVSQAHCEGHVQLVDACARLDMSEPKYDSEIHISLSDVEPTRISELTAIFSRVDLLAGSCLNSSIAGQLGRVHYQLPVAYMLLTSMDVS